MLRLRRASRASRLLRRRRASRVTRLLRRLGIRGATGAERVTLLLALTAVGTAGSVLFAEYGRRLARRIEQHGGGEEIGEHPAEALLAAGQATQDTVRVALAGYGAASRHETVLFNLLSGFLGAFALARVSTSGIRAGWWPSGNVRVGGRHIHHFVPGILLAFGAGAAALITEDPGRETALAIPFGAGVGFTFDEAALLLDLRDNYWTQEGVLSVQMSLGMASVLGGTILALRMLRRGERRELEQGLLPSAGDAEQWIAHGAPMPA